jgi:AcrR family transcriptional regulator
MIEHRGPADWVRTALSCLGERGIDAVRIEPLAKTLGVTKGSFYWHFADRSALYAAMLAEWERATTVVIIEQVEAQGGTPRARLLDLSYRTSEADSRLEMAVRAWASVDAIAADAVARVDRRRLDYLEVLLREAGLPARAARARARLSYYALIGSFAIVRKNPAATRERRAAIRLNHAMLLRWP